MLNSVSVEIDPLVRHLRGIQRDQIPFMVALTLTRLSRLGYEDLQQLMRRRFATPTPFFMRSINYKKATKRALYSSYGLRDDTIGGKRVTGVEIFGHLFEGGERREKGLEFWARQAGLINSHERLIPGDGVKLNSRGDVSGAEVVRIMSQIKIGGDSSAFKTKSKRSIKARKGQRYFWPSRGSNLPRGIYVQYKDRTFEIAFFVAPAARYRQFINLTRRGQRIVDRHLTTEFSKAFEFAMRTAR